jgi:hypothetical protein
LAFFQSASNSLFNGQSVAQKVSKKSGQRVAAKASKSVVTAELGDTLVRFGTPMTFSKRSYILRSLMSQSFREVHAKSSELPELVYERQTSI